MRWRRFFSERTPAAPSLGIVIFVGIVGANGSVIMPALFVDAGCRSESNTLNDGGWWSLHCHSCVGRRPDISAELLAVAFVALRWLASLSHSCRVPVLMLLGASGTADRLSLSHSQRCHLQPHAARTSRPGTGTVSAVMPSASPM